MKNMKKETVLVNLNEHLKQQLDTTEELFPTVDVLYLLTNERKIHGAVQILNENILKFAANLFGNDFLILPSSIHETLLLSISSEFADAEALTHMVHEINCTQLAIGEILSNHVYRYDSKTGSIIIVA